MNILCEAAGAVCSPQTDEPTNAALTQVPSLLTACGAKEKKKVFIKILAPFQAIDLVPLSLSRYCYLQT